MELHVFPIPIPPSTSLSTWFLWIFPVHQAQAFLKQNIIILPPTHGRIIPLWDKNPVFWLKMGKVVESLLWLLRSCENG